MDSTSIFQFFASFKYNLIILPQNSKFWTYSDRHHNLSILNKSLIWLKNFQCAKFILNVTQNMNITNTNTYRDFYLQFYLYLTQKWPI